MNKFWRRGAARRKSGASGRAAARKCGARWCGGPAAYGHRLPRPSAPVVSQKKVKKVSRKISGGLKNPRKLSFLDGQTCIKVGGGFRSQPPPISWTPRHHREHRFRHHRVVHTTRWLRMIRYEPQKPDFWTSCSRNTRARARCGYLPTPRSLMMALSPFT